MARKAPRKRKYFLRVLNGQFTVQDTPVTLRYVRAAAPLRLPAYPGQHFMTLVPVQSLEETVGGLAGDTGTYMLTGRGAALLRSQPTKAGEYRLTGASASLRVSRQTARSLVAYAGQHFVTLPPVESVEETAGRFTTGADSGVYLVKGSAAALRRTSSVSRSLRAYAGLHVFSLPPTEVVEEQAFPSGTYHLIGQAVPLNGR